MKRGIVSKLSELKNEVKVSDKILETRKLDGCVIRRRKRFNGTTYNSYDVSEALLKELLGL